MIVDLFLRTFPGDYPWLPCLLRSMSKHVRGFSNLIVVVPDGSALPLDVGFPLVGVDTVRSVKFARCHIYPDDYIGQQITKLRSWEYSDADEICFLDSDLVFRRHFDPTTLEIEKCIDCGWGVPYVETRPWSDVGTAVQWREPTAEILGFDPPFETMARHPFQYSRSMIQRCYNAIGGETRLLGTGKTFSEFNVLGNWAIREGIEAIPVDLQARPDIVRQFWSRGGITQEVEAEMRQLGVWDEVGKLSSP